MNWERRLGWRRLGWRGGMARRTRRGPAGSGSRPVLARGARLTARNIFARETS
jgi:hypothetical protein